MELSPEAVLLLLILLIINSFDRHERLEAFKLVVQVFKLVVQAVLKPAAQLRRYWLGQVLRPGQVDDDHQLGAGTEAGPEDTNE